MAGDDERVKGLKRILNAEDDGKSWKPAVARIRAQQYLINTPSPSNAGIARQIQHGKIWVRSRIKSFCDEGTFQELGSITGRPVVDEQTGELTDFNAANLIMGYGKLEGRPIFLTADDFSVRGGHADGGVFGKARHGESMAVKARIPLVRLLDGSSGGGSVATYLEGGTTYIPRLLALSMGIKALRVIPVACALLGPVVGLAAGKAVASHFSVMVKGIGQLFAAGPPIVKQAIFENMTKEELGGWEIHGTNGTVDNVVSSEEEAFAQVRSFLSYLPPSVYSLPPIKRTDDPSNRRDEELISIIPRRRARSYDIRAVIAHIVDKDSFFEIGELWGKCIVTGFARIAGRPIGVLSSDCTQGGGVLDALGAQKTGRFVELCDLFSLPILNLVDQPGFAVGSAAERSATLRHGLTAMLSFSRLTVPLFTVVARRAFGVAGGAFVDPDDAQNNRIAWPSADWGSLPLEGGVEAAYKRKLDAIEKEGGPEAREKATRELLEKFEDVRDPIHSAHRFIVEEIVDPRDTRPLVCQWIKHVYEYDLPWRITARIAQGDVRVKL